MAMQPEDNLAISVRGRFFRTAGVRDEPIECLTNPQPFIARLKQEGIGADLFTFMQEITDTVPRYSFHAEFESFAVLTLSTYENWWKNQIIDKTRNLVRKAQKNGVEIRGTDLTDAFVREVSAIYNESPILQGRRNWHYGKDFETMKRMLGTFPERSEFAGAYFNGELIGFIKVVHGENFASLMHIMSKMAHRDKAVANALVAKAVEMCAQRQISTLLYGSWSRRGMGLFKRNHAFERRDVPRYFVPLNFKGRLMLRLGLHRSVRQYLPDPWVDKAVDLRNKWNQFKYGSTPLKATAGQRSSS
jgi:hypothetical protein